MADQNQNNPGWPPGSAPGFFGPFNAVGPFANPGQTNPFPLPTNTPVPCHDCGAAITLPWGPGSIAGNPVVGVVEATVYTAFWRSPIFDLRPELRGSSMSAPQGVAPIWRSTYGAGGQLFVQVENLLFSNTSLNGLVVNTVESGHVNDVGRVQTIAQAEDVSSNFTNAQQSAVLAIMPPGSGYPLRYWQVTIYFDILASPAAPPTPPPFILSAAYY